VPPPIGAEREHPLSRRYRRSVIQSLLRDNQDHHFDVVLAEGLDRLSRNQADVAQIYQQMSFTDTLIHTQSEGEISELHIGLKGTMGAKQLRNRWEMRSWKDLRNMVGDAYTEFCEKIRYTRPTTDSNRARWPLHNLWREVASVIANDLHENCSGVLPSDVIETNRAEHLRMLDRQILGLLVSHAAASGIQPSHFGEFLDTQIEAIQRMSDEHPIPIRLQTH